MIASASPARRVDVLAAVYRVVGNVLVVGLLVVSFTPVVNLAARALAPSAPVTRADAIVVLGAGANPDGSLAPESLVRIVRGVTLYREGLAPLLVVSGSAGETRTRLALVRVLGVPDGAVVAKWNAQTTRDEAADLGTALRPRGVDRILLVSNTQHLIRAQRLFEKQGFAVVPVPADAESVSSAAPQVRLEIAAEVTAELLARLYYRIAGYL